MDYEEMELEHRQLLSQIRNNKNTPVEPTDRIHLEVFTGLRNAFLSF